MPDRPVDSAMASEREEKKTIRNLWLDEVANKAATYDQSEGIPLYLTLPGAEGIDIQLLIDNGLVGLEENGAISESDQVKIVAVESSNLAVAKLQSKFVGLKIKEAPFNSLIRGEGPLRWPQGTEEMFCKALVVNLDLNQPLRGEMEDQEGQPTFRVLAWIQKLCQLHTEEWSLLLTLHGEIHWPSDVDIWIKDFLRDNMDGDEQFRSKCEEFLGVGLVASISSEDSLCDLKNSEQQTLLMVIVPKIIAQLVYTTGWSLQTEYNIKYGGQDSTAPIVSWIFRFARASEIPQRIYQGAIQKIFHRLAHIAPSGELLEALGQPSSAPP